MPKKYSQEFRDELRKFYYENVGGERGGGSVIVKAAKKFNISQATVNYLLYLNGAAHSIAKERRK